MIVVGINTMELMRRNKSFTTIVNPIRIIVVAVIIKVILHILYFTQHIFYETSRT